jgi:RNA polymerase-binding transcription factor DksA
VHDASASETSRDDVVSSNGWLENAPRSRAAAAEQFGDLASQQVDGVTSAFVSVALARLERDHVVLLAAVCQLESDAAAGLPAATAATSPVLREALKALLREDLRQTQRALRLAADGAYGTCEICHTALPIHVLLDQPATTRCQSCAVAAERARQVH